MCVCNDLPPVIVPALRALVQRVSALVVSQRDASLADHEAGLLAAWRAVSGALLGAVITATTTGCDATQRPPRGTCPACHQGCAADRVRPRQLQTQLGAVAFARTVYYCAPCGHRWSEADETLRLAPHQRTSAGLDAWEAWLGGVTSFREGAALLADLAGVRVGVETLRTHAEQAGAALESVQQQQIAAVQGTEAAVTGTAESAPGHLVVETDGVMVRYRGAVGEPGVWHEVKLGIVGGWSGTRPTATLQAASYVAARESVVPFARRLGAEATRRGALDVVGWTQPPGTDPRIAGVLGPALAVLRPVVVLGDGAAWIWETVAPTFTEERIEIVDWFHASEHVWALADALHGPTGATRRAWAEDAVARLWTDGTATGLLPLLRATVPIPGTEAATVLERESGYFTRNAARMDYPTYRARNLPIGSGAIESTAKYLVQQRMKRAGMHWSEPGAHAILQLRCQSLTNDARHAPMHRPHAHHAKAA